MATTPRAPHLPSPSRRCWLRRQWRGNWHFLRTFFVLAEFDLSFSIWGEVKCLIMIKDRRKLSFKLWIQYILAQSNNILLWRKPWSKYLETCDLSVTAWLYSVFTCQGCGGELKRGGWEIKTEILTREGGETEGGWEGEIFTFICQEHQIILNPRFHVNNWTWKVFNQVLGPEREAEVSDVLFWAQEMRRNNECLVRIQLCKC